MDQVAAGPAKELTPSRAWYQASVAEFLAADPASVFGTLASAGKVVGAAGTGGEGGE